MDAAFLSVLTTNGFDEKEARVYVALLELGEAVVTDVARRAELKRSITYVLLHRLMERGFVSELPGRKVQRFTAVDPQRVVTNIQSNFNALKQLLPVLRAAHNVGVSRPRIEVFEGAEGVASVYHSFELGREGRFMAAMAQHEARFPTEVKRWIAGLRSGLITTRVRHLVPDDAAGRRFALALKGVTTQVVRFLPKGVNVSLDFGIVDDRVAITSFEPLYIVTMKSEPIATSMTTLFDLAWSRGKPAR
ncbi:MAG: helix-turn-helix domain-containing protein [bacterium]|nr:helix-turn-helix domain-containing protein [bacterium]